MQTFSLFVNYFKVFTPLVMSERQNTSSTPKKVNTESDISFSPVTSPAPQYDSRHQGNLTGTLRKVKDTAADVHNLVLKWKKCNTDGRNIITEIANIKLEKVFSLDGEDIESSLPESLEPLCVNLTSVYQNMEKVVGKLQHLRTSMYGLESLMQHQGEEDKILFNTWNVKDFVNTLDELVKMYTKELSLKKSIVENVAHAEDRTTMMFYSASWIHEPYIEDSANMLLESLIVETGHR